MEDFEKINARWNISADKLHQVAGGRNNRLYKANYEGRDVAIKLYFRHPDDPRDRWFHENEFLKFAENFVGQQIPRIIESVRETGMCMMEWIDGQKINAEDIVESHVLDALNFWEKLNQDHDAVSDKMPNASEACFTPKEHIDLVEKRIQKLDGLNLQWKLTKEILPWIENKLVPQFERIREMILPLSDDRSSGVKRCLSPSDFGFHNVLIRRDGCLCYLDFEYAGWDDPRKTLADFYCQPRVPVKGMCLERFCEATARMMDRDFSLEEAKTWMRLYRIKWICIMLNEYVGTDSERRKYAMGEDNWEQHLESQWLKIQSYYEQGEF